MHKGKKKEKRETGKIHYAFGAVRTLRNRKRKRLEWMG